jgi:hypothetical protein
MYIETSNVGWFWLLGTVVENEGTFANEPTFGPFACVWLWMVFVCLFFGYMKKEKS